MSLDATIGGSTSNSYVTLEYADEYFADRLNSDAWFVSVGKQEKALITATRRIDEESFYGLKTSLTQALKWPRFNVEDEDGFYMSSDSIPERVKQATCITALELIRADFLAENYLDNFSFLATGALQFKQFTQKRSGALPADALRLLRQVLLSGSGSAKLVRA